MLPGGYTAARICAVHSDGAMCAVKAHNPPGAGRRATLFARGYTEAGPRARGECTASGVCTWQACKGRPRRRRAAPLDGAMCVVGTHNHPGTGRRASLFAKGYTGAGPHARPGHTSAGRGAHRASSAATGLWRRGDSFDRRTERRGFHIKRRAFSPPSPTSPPCIKPPLPSPPPPRPGGEE